MHIAVEARALANRGSGTRTYTHQLLRHLLRIGTDDRFTLFLDQPDATRDLAKARQYIIRRPAEWLLPWWLQYRLPRAVRLVRPDIVHFTKADVARLAIPSVVTLFDIIPLLFPESQAFSRRLYWSGALKRAATRSTHVITISEATKNDIIRRYGRDPAEITVTKLAVDLARFQPSALAGRARTILFVGTRDRRKNVGALLRAFARIAQDVPHHVVIAGKSALRPDQAEAEARRLGIASRVTFIDFVPADELPALYRSAELFVWPSVYEGWGFPPQEAMACGTPVIVSDGGALPEVVGTAGRVVPFTQAALEARTNDSDFERRLADEMRSVLDSSQRRQAMHEAGLQRVRKFSWDAVALATRQVYERVASL